MDKEFAQKLIDKTTADYNRIAALWSTKRWQSPSDMLALREHIEKGDQILDLGCGNGIFYEAVKDLDVDYTGADTSKELIGICKEKYPSAKFLVVEPFSIPFPDNTFDKIFSLSVIHHIPTDSFREKFLAEIKRVLKPEGLLALSAWNIEDSKMTKWWLENKQFFPELKEFESGDLLYPFKNSRGETEIYRYLHNFSKDALRRLLSQSGFSVEEIKVISRGKGSFSNLISFSRNK